jgi:hypothetical protein
MNPVECREKHKKKGVQMKRIMMLSVVTSSLILAGGDIAPVEVEAVAPTAEAFTFFNNVTAKGEIRPRYEFVNTKNVTGNANALTNRLTLGMSADLFQVDGLSTYLEATNVTGLGHYFNLSKGDISDNGVYNVVADPSQTRITQAYIDYATGKTLIRAGRQGVNLDNQRFIGTVNWRQMPQTYDAVAMINNSMENLSLLAAYVWHVNTIFDNNSIKPVGGGFNTDTVLLHASYKTMDALMLTVYDYMIKDTHDTYGIAATGKFAFNDNTGLHYRAEYAKQKNASIGKSKANAHYYNVETTLNMSGFLAGVRYEVLGAGSGANAAFSTPLATLHGQNGWADIFLGTPANGLVDVNGMIGYKAKGFGVAKVVYHNFTSDRGSTHYGTETDILYKNKISAIKGLSGMLKAAFYHASAYKVDTTKYWVMLDYKF